MQPWWFLFAFGVVSTANWIVRGRALFWAECITKPLATLLLLVFVWMSGSNSTTSPWLLGGLGFSLLGDVFLLNEKRFFVFGIASFLVAHILYSIGFGRVLGTPSSLWLGVVVAIALSLPVALVILPRVARSQRRLLFPVACYLVVIAWMLASAYGSGIVIAAIGATVFAISDTMIAWRKFVRPFRFAPVLVMVTYHLAQLFISLALV